MTRPTFKKISFVLLAVVLSGTLYLSTTYATLAPGTPPPSGGYDAGSNSILDPGCGPTDTDCFVKPITADNGLTATGSNIQLGGTLLQDTFIETDGNVFAVANGITGGSLDATGLMISTSGPFSIAKLASGSDAENSEVAIQAVTYGAGAYGQILHTNGDTGNIANVSVSNSYAEMHVFDDVQNEDIDVHVTDSGAYMIYRSASFATTQTVGLLVQAAGVESKGSDPTNGYNAIWSTYDPTSFEDTRVNAYLENDGDWTWYSYKDNRDDSGIHTPVNFLYSDNAGNLLSAPLSVITGGGSDWSRAGNSISTGDFIGTTNSQDFVIKANNNEIARFYQSTGASTGSVAFGGGVAPSAYMFVYGANAGIGATAANDSNFIGYSAGNGAINSSYSNFIGHGAGYLATDATQSNFVGDSAGYQADSANNANFYGAGAGFSATNAAYSVFIGNAAGSGATNASNSIFIGKSAGYSDTLIDNTTDPDDFSILIGANTQTGGFSNSIALGADVVNTASNQFMIGSATRPINTLVITGAGGNTCILDVTVASPSCSSDETLKTNIEDLSTTDTLTALLNVKTVTYNWINYPNKGRQIGFLAQDLEQYFPEVVSQAPNGFKTVSYGGMTPILVEAIRELNFKVSDFSSTNTNPTSLMSIIREWLGDVTNGITKIFAGEVETKNLCVADDSGNKTCITKSQLDSLLLNTPVVTPSNPVVTPDPVVNDTTPPADTPTDPTTGDTPDPAPDHAPSTPPPSDPGPSTPAE